MSSSSGCVLMLLPGPMSGLSLSIGNSRSRPSVVVSFHTYKYLTIRSLANLHPPQHTQSTHFRQLYLITTMVSKYDRPSLAGHAIHWPLLALQFLCGVLILAFSSAAVAQANGNTASAINYEVFLGIIILLWVFAVAGAPYLPILGQEMIRVPLDGLLMLLTFAGGVALAVRLRVHSCGNENYVSQPLFHGSANICRLLQATCAFTWFSFAGFLVTSIFGAISFCTGAPATQRGSRKPRQAPATV